MRVHASVYTRVSLNAVWAGGGRVAPSPQPPDPRLEVTVVAVPPDLSLEACCLVCLEGWSDLRWDSDTCSPSPSTPPKSDQGAGGNISGSCAECGILEAARDLLSSCFMTPGAGQAGGDRCCPDSHLTWLLLLKFPATGSPKLFLGELGLSCEQICSLSASERSAPGTCPQCWVCRVTGNSRRASHPSG